MASDDESSDEFGMVKKELDEEETAPRPKSLAAKSKPEPKTKGDKPKRQQKAEQAPADTKIVKLISQAKTLAGALEVITPLAYWQRAVKPKDCETKIEKSYDVIAALEVAESEEARALANQLKEMAEGVLKFIETIGLFQYQLFEEDWTDQAQECDASSLERLCLLPADCLNAILSDIGRKLVEEFQGFFGVEFGSRCMLFHLMGFSCFLFFLSSFFCLRFIPFMK